MWSNILTLASTFFQDMFNLPQPKDQDGTPVVDVSEDSPVIDALLHIIYPVKCQPLTDIELIRKVLGAALEYDVSVGVQEICGLLVTRHSSSGEDALRTYAITCQYKLEDEARLAAKTTLQFPITEVYVKEVELIPAGDYIRLLEYRRKAVAAMAAFIRPDVDAAIPPEIRRACCSRYFEWARFVTNANTVLCEAPWSQTVFSIHFVKTFYHSMCRSCGRDSHSQWTAVIEYLKAESERRIDKIQLSVKF
ncbi:hypothetical protein BD410DRAFT_532425 [Rickenella mellea]|uniref:BTB domain-containing protein n=1 Tax=Rickenella mellea TaxID=50990 RepID=A0A4Y7QHK3_9AGAM|nr:hypothetical protein BD410DRAFT_532425 [Rickenella mellea]